MALMDTKVGMFQKKARHTLTVKFTAGSFYNLYLQTRQHLNVTTVITMNSIVNSITG